MTPASHSLLATRALLAMTACWGSTFFLIKDLLDRVPVLDFLAVRFAIAAVALLADRAAGARPAVAAGARRARSCWRLLYGVAQILQTAGLAHTPASVSGFITGMYVVCTPLLAAVLLRHPDHRGDLGRGGARDVGLGGADARGALRRATARRSRFVAAVLYALHIVGLGAWSTARARPWA